MFVRVKPTLNEVRGVETGSNKDVLIRHNDFKKGFKFD